MPLSFETGTLNLWSIKRLCNLESTKKVTYLMVYGR